MKEKTPLVSIVVPAYNCEDYIEECITKILNQTYQNLQIIIVDDGSSDNTFELCKSFFDSRITLLKKQNGGASSARNVGLEHITGEYLMFVDSDDYLELEAVESLIATAKEKNADLVYYEADNFSIDRRIQIKENGFAQKKDYPMMCGNDLIPQLIANKDYHAAPFLFFIKSEILNNGLRFKEGIMMEDELFSFQLFRSCEKVVCMRRELYHRRVRPGSVMTSQGKEVFRYISIRTVFQELLKDLKENNNDTTLKLYLSRIAMLMIGYWEQIPPDKREPLREQYNSFLGIIRKRKGFGEKELVVRTYGELLWAIYVLPNRLAKRIMQRLT